MSLRIFILGLLASFGVAWLVMVVVPFYKMRALPAVHLDEAADGATGVFYPKRAGRTLGGAEVYGENGCYQCHTQLIRPTYAGNDLFRADWGGLKSDPDRGDTRRETTAYDYYGEKFAQIGVTRTGPDLSNFGRRVLTYKDRSQQPMEPEAWLYRHLYRPRSLAECWTSNCPPHPYLFQTVDAKGGSPGFSIPKEALFRDPGEGKAVIPGPDARALVSYLLSLKKDQQVPKVLDFTPAQQDGKKP